MKVTPHARMRRPLAVLLALGLLLSLTALASNASVARKAPVTPVASAQADSAVRVAPTADGMTVEIVRPSFKTISLTVPIMPFSYLTGSCALCKYLTYRQYKVDIANAAYVCMRGIDLDPLAQLFYAQDDLTECVNSRMMYNAHSARARLWHAINWYTTQYWFQQERDMYSSFLTLYGWVAKGMWGAELTVSWWIAEQGVCIPAGAAVGLRLGTLAGGLAGSACEKAFYLMRPPGVV